MPEPSSTPSLPALSPSSDSPHPEAVHNPERRQWLKLMLGGATVVAGTGILWGWPLSDRGWSQLPRAMPQWAFLDRRRAAIIQALLPVFLAGAWPSSPTEQAAAERYVLQAFDKRCALLSPIKKNQLEELFTVLDLAPTRRWLAGIRAHWLYADIQSLEHFLQNWRHSRLASLRHAYYILRELILSSWYAHQTSWLALKFTGLPQGAVRKGA